MSYQFPPDVDRLVRDRMAAGGYLSEDDVLRDALVALAERADDLSAIQAGIADMEAGRTRSLSEVDLDIRGKLGFAPRK